MKRWVYKYCSWSLIPSAQKNSVVHAEYVITAICTVDIPSRRSITFPPHWASNLQINIYTEDELYSWSNVFQVIIYQWFTFDISVFGRASYEIRQIYFILSRWTLRLILTPKLRWMSGMLSQIHILFWRIKVEVGDSLGFDKLENPVKNAAVS